MSQYKVTFKRIEAFYETILVDGQSTEEARAHAEQLSMNGDIYFDYCKESDLLDEHIINIEKV